MLTGLRQEIHKMSLKCLVMPETKKAIKGPWGHVKRNNAKLLLMANGGKFKNRKE